MQIERKIDEISDIIQSKIKTDLEDHFGVNLKRLDIEQIELDKEHPHYQQLKRQLPTNKRNLPKPKRILK